MTHERETKMTTDDFDPMDHWLEQNLEPVTTDALILRNRGRFIRHGVMCSLDADLVKRVSAHGARRITYGAAVEAQILRDCAKAKEVV